MINHGIPLDKAELLSVLLEGILYGFSVLMFGVTIWVLLARQSIYQVNYKMLTVVCLLLALSTVHIIIHIIRVMDGLLLSRDTYKGGPAAFFSDISHWTFVSKNHVYTAQTLLGDGVILYRCYIICQSKLIIILPALLWLAAGITGVTATYTAQHATQTGVFGGSLSQWITSFWASALATNLTATFLLLSRMWNVDRQAVRPRNSPNSQLQSILRILIDAGVIYSLTLLVALICFVTQTNGQYVILDMVTPIISITFYMVIIRLRMPLRVNQSTNIPLGNTPNDSLSTIGRHGVQVHISTLTESRIEALSTSPTRPILSKCLDEIKLEDMGMAV